MWQVEVLNVWNARRSSQLATGKYSEILGDGIVVGKASVCVFYFNGPGLRSQTQGDDFVVIGRLGISRMVTSTAVTQISGDGRAIGPRL